MFIKKIAVVSVMMGLAFTSLSGCATSNGSLPTDAAVRQSMQVWSVDDHLQLAGSAKETIENLENQIETVQARIEKFKGKPYLDTKGFKRQSLGRWKGKLVNDLREAADTVVWHETQAKEMGASQQNDQRES